VGTYISYNSYYVVKIIVYNYTKMFNVCGFVGGACGVQVFSLYTGNFKISSISKFIKNEIKIVFMKEVGSQVLATLCRSS